MVTKGTKNLPEIKWECYSISNRDPEEREVNYDAKGVDSKGNIYSGTAQFVCGEFEEMKDIQIESDFCAICGDYGPTKCTPQANCLNIPLKNFLTPSIL